MSASGLQIDPQTRGRDSLEPVELRITGMTCGACVQRVERALGGVPGVRDATVNLMTESAEVRLSQPVQTPALVQAVRSAGYDAERMAGARAAAPAGESDRQRDEQVRRQRQAMIQAIGLALPILALDHYGHHLHSHFGAAGELGWRVLQAALTIMLCLSSAGAPILIGGVRAAMHRAPNMDTLIATGVLAAVLGSLYGTLAQEAAFNHYHAAAMILLLISIGKYLEARARGRATSAMAALARRAPSAARVRRDGSFVLAPVEQVAVGDVVQVVPHSAVPVDGEIVEGEVSVDESLMTGEPLPVSKGAGDVLRAGTLIVEGVATCRATQVGRASTMGRIVDLVRRAQATRTRMQRLADQVAAVFTPIVIVLAILTFLGWVLFYRDAGTAAAMSAAIAVLVVACPCAMGLATPTTVLVASTRAALRGILVRDAATLETLGRIETVVWDKTGTLTAGRPVVTALRTSDPPEDPADENIVLRLAAGAEQFSVHPLATAIVAEARRRGVSIPEPDEFESITGGGVRARIEGRDVIVGSVALLERFGVERDSLADAVGELSSAGRTVVAVAVDGVARAVIGLEDVPRPSAREAVARLERLGVRNVMLTGDSPQTARAIGAQVGIAGIHAGVDPAGKVETVRRLKSSGQGIAMVGDGVNDAAALSAADVGIAFATGSDVALESAGINLIGSTPHLVADAVEIARHSLRIIKENLFWAFIYNILMIPLAAIGRLPPGWAAGAMMVSSLTVVLNALRLRLRKA